MKNFYRIANINSDQTTELEDLLHRLEINKKHLNYAQQIADIGSWEYFIKEDIFYCSDHCYDIFGIDKNVEVSLDKLFEYIHPEDRNGFMEIVNKAINQGINYSTDIRIYRGKIDDLRYIKIQAEAVLDGDLPYKITGVIRDCTSEKRLENCLHHLANHDELTGLPNRLSLVNYLDVLKNNETDFAVLYIEISQLNNINDSLGYLIADEVLLNITDTLRNIIGEMGKVFKFNTDHFFLVLENYVNKKEIYYLKNEIIEQLEQFMIIRDYRIHISVNVGVSFFLNPKKDTNEIIKDASSALFQAKKAKSYKGSADVHMINNQLIKDMESAIKNEDFELYFQPQISLCTGDVVGLEALIRWNHYERGLITPLEFIPLAEESHLINDLTDWVISESVEIINKCKKNGMSVPISINVSPIRLMKEGLVTFIEEKLNQYQVSPELIELEITESAFLNNDKNVKYTIKQLRELGVRIAIDDFGTGYSSFNYIREFDIDTLKIDKVFVQNINNLNSKDAAIVTSVLNLAKALDVKAIAEGVETEEQLSFLNQNGCELAQGFLFSKPVPFKEIIKILNHKRYFIQN